MTVAFVGLGSNLDDPPARLRAGLAGLRGLRLTSLQACSRLYLSPPMGPQDQPDYYNAVACLETDLQPHELLTALQAIEVAEGRRRVRPWGPRTLDLDLLSMGDIRVMSATLALPHSGVLERDFVLAPWAEIAPDYVVPGLGPVAQLLHDCPARGARPLDEPQTRLETP
ncbi:2-amino-4-hydroxy-6-hydroxymethyldihydropteridine diphosphokinase [Natronocella acetinitrilica]|uniref:2-amino-4-hydroxy-6-hydroxymethyldihydropteridine pyrophosphokinase n=1 Tax=Natronocella acetinitrilica TaxID=414046 RepID=A0AAE3G410_9GAMM|nr:2-amino-4-hydroxy-6-hydroxymethyldihydropteridine diphosphokinase [Natronocella acetinitrilica]